jgi:hypothetical protein
LMAELGAVVLRIVLRQRDFEWRALIFLRGNDTASGFLPSIV